MIERVIKLRNLDARALIERFASENGLVTKKLGLASAPDSTHWHLSMPRQKGTLELTLDPHERTLVFKVAKNRQGEWIDQMIEQLIAKLEKD